MNYIESIKDQTTRSLWSIKNVINCTPNECWNKEYCGMPMWKHVYYTIHSLDQYYINPNHYQEPIFSY